MSLSWKMKFHHCYLEEVITTYLHNGDIHTLMCFNIGLVWPLRMYIKYIACNLGLVEFYLLIIDSMYNNGHKSRLKMKFAAEGKHQLFQWLWWIYVDEVKSQAEMMNIPIRRFSLVCDLDHADECPYHVWTSTVSMNENMHTTYLCICGTVHFCRVVAWWVSIPVYHQRMKRIEQYTLLLV